MACGFIKALNIRIHRVLSNHTRPFNWHDLSRIIYKTKRKARSPTHAALSGKQLLVLSIYSPFSAGEEKSLIFISILFVMRLKVRMCSTKETCMKAVHCPTELISTGCLDQDPIWSMSFGRPSDPTWLHVYDGVGVFLNIQALRTSSTWANGNSCNVWRLHCSMNFGNIAGFLCWIIH